MKLVLIDNLAPHYRGPIFRLLDSEIGLDFYVGDKQDDIRKMDYSGLAGKVTEVHNVYLPRCYYQTGVINVLFKPYDTYLVFGDMRCISVWILLVGQLFFPGKRFFLWSHGDLGRGGGLRILLMKLFYSMAAGAFIYNERSRKIMMENGIPGGKLHTIYNSLDYDNQLKLRQGVLPEGIFKEHFGNNDRNIIFIGRLTKVKSLDLILKAVAALKRCGENYNVTFVGDGTERHNLQVLADDLELKERVWFYGASYDERTNAGLINNADVCVSPGNIGLTAIYVMMFGCPAITNDDFNHQMPEFEAIIEGRTGSFFKDGDVNSLADTIRKWFEVHGDDRVSIRRNCYRIVDDKWNPHNQIKIFRDVLLQ